MTLSNNKPSMTPRPLREWLIKINLDLFKIHSFVLIWSAYYPEKLTNLENMTIALEDRRFFYHKGWDFRSLVREISKAVTFRRHGGASTIDMQFVRTATGYRNLSFRRKMYEIFLSRIIQYRYSKVVILRSYLSCAYFGSHLIGADRASIAIYGKVADDLLPDEAATIASMLVYPKPLQAGKNWEQKVLRRARYGVKVNVRCKESLYKFKI